MHLRCSHCHLTLPAHYFMHQNTWQSLCVFCRQRDLNAQDFYNGDVAAYAHALQSPYVGASKPQSQPTQSLDKHLKKMITSLIQSYDASPVALHRQIPLTEFIPKVLAIEDETLPYESTGNFNQDMGQLGFDLSQIFHQNQLDYTTRQLVREKYHYTCQYCGRYGDSVDHKDPVFHSQDNELTNLTLSCKACNRLKGDMPYALFVRLNRQLQTVNQQLVTSQQALKRLSQRIQANQQQLAAQMHLTSDPTDPKLQPYRTVIKTLQFVYDSLNSDYQQLEHLRHDYIVSHAKVALDFPDSTPDS